MVWLRSILALSVLWLSSCGGGGGGAPAPTAPGLYSATRSIVLFGEDGGFFRFDAASGTRSLVIEAGPQGLWANDGVVVFSLGGGKIYRVQ